MNPREEIAAFARESLGITDCAEGELIPFEGRGSDRAYYRFKWGAGQSAILVDYELKRAENAYYAEIALFLQQKGIPVPEIIRHDAEKCILIMGDLGDTDLWLLRDESWDLRRKLYHKTLEIVHRLHSIPEKLFPYKEVRLMEAFGPALYSWEREYFRENFVEGLCAITLDPPVRDKLEQELQALAARLESGRKSLVHRDLQSQNVMINGGEPFLIDFQGMRFGTRFYDLGSLLCDPYVSFSLEERRELLLFYYQLSEPEMSWEDFQTAFWEASAQRLMQALGAYGFLGMKKGLKSYLAHVPSGIRNLRAAAQNASSLPILLEICVRAEARSQEPGARIKASNGGDSEFPG